MCVCVCFVRSCFNIICVVQYDQSQVEARLTALLRQHDTENRLGSGIFWRGEARVPGVFLLSLGSCIAEKRKNEISYTFSRLGPIRVTAREIHVYLLLLHNNKNPKVFLALGTRG